MILVLPCGGESSRFPGLRAKWLLTQPNGNLMVCDAIAKLDLKNVNKIVLIAHEKHVLGQEKNLKSAFLASGCEKEVEFFTLDRQTKSQPETVAEFLMTLTDDVSFFVKDCDGQYDATPEPVNEVMTADIGCISGASCTSKSYCKVNESGDVIAIVEKQVISRDFCVGGYSFQSSKDFLRSYEQIKHYDNLYVSHVIENMIVSNDQNFKAKKCSGYEDWGTVRDWHAYKKTFGTLFLDIDGVLFKNSSAYFKPKWGESEPIQSNIDALKRVINSGRVQVILTTARTVDYAEITERQLKESGIEYHQILYGMLHAQRIVINDYSQSNPYRCCDAINLKRDSEDLGQMLNSIGL